MRVCNGEEIFCCLRFFYYIFHLKGLIERMSSQGKLILEECYDESASTFLERAFYVSVLYIG